MFSGPLHISCQLSSRGLNCGANSLANYTALKRLNKTELAIFILLWFFVSKKQPFYYLFYFVIILQMIIGALIRTCMFCKGDGKRNELKIREVVCGVSTVDPRYLDLDHLE